MDAGTKEYYEKNALGLVGKYAQAGDVNARHFGFAFPRHVTESFRVLDVGAGTGRDVLFLLEQGYNAFGLEPCEEMRNVALGQSRALKQRIFAGKVDTNLATELGAEKFNGILCSAVLQHVERAKLVSACVWLKSLLAEKGRLFLSTPAATETENIESGSDARDEHGRIFNRWPRDFLVLLFERLNFRLIDSWTSPDSLGRANAGWHNFVFALEDNGQKGGLERIEDIIFRDKKTSTYKIALIKALCEVAISGERDVHFANEGVHVPLKRVSEIWFRDYWPLVVGNMTTLLPQNTLPHIAFEKELQAIASATQQRDVRLLESLAVPGSEIGKLHSSALRAIGGTILKNPVHYAGKQSSTKGPFAPGKMGGKQTVLVQHDVWRELVLFGRWLKDALVFEWARWSANLATKKDLNPELVLQETIRILTATNEQARDTSVARSIFERAAATRATQCTWTGHTLQRFDIDHILPYAHFANNALWNLVPASPAANNEKSDRPPSTKILENSRDRLFGAWSTGYQHSPNLFEAEATSFTGMSQMFTTSTPWQSSLFDALWESVAIYQAGDARRVWEL